MTFSEKQVRKTWAKLITLGGEIPVQEMLRLNTARQLTRWAKLILIHFISLLHITMLHFHPISHTMLILIVQVHHPSFLHFTTHALTCSANILILIPRTDRIDFRDSLTLFRFLCSAFIGRPT